jgi:hypothetical protein
MRELPPAAFGAEQPGRTPDIESVPIRRGGRALLAVTLLALFAFGPDAWTQYPQYPPPYPYPPPSAPIGPTAGATLRNAAAATSNQAGIVRKGAYDWGRRANAGLYRVDQFQVDYANSLVQFQNLRTQFGFLAASAAQLGRPRANNAIAELDAGLNIIGELFPFLESQFNAGTLDQQTIVRTCKSLEDAMREWEREFKRSSSRIGLAW